MRERRDNRPGTGRIVPNESFRKRGQKEFDLRILSSTETWRNDCAELTANSKLHPSHSCLAVGAGKNM